MSGTNKLRVMLVDDHAVLRAGLRMLVNSQADMEVVAEADNAADAMVHALTDRPDVVVLDLTMPGGGAMALIERLASQPAPPRILVLTMHDDPAYVRAALAAGSTGYVVKTIGERDLLAAIREAARGRVVVDLDDPARTAAVFGSAATPRKPTDPLIATARLSERETEVLRLLGQGCSNQTVAQRLDLSPKTVATYRARIADKLGLKTTEDFVRYASRTGLLESPAAMS